MYPMRLIVLVVMCALLVAAPVSAQNSTPSTGGTIVRDLTEAAQAMGSTSVVLIIIVLVQGGIVAFLISVARSGIAPLMKTIESLNTQNNTLQSHTRLLGDQLTERLRLGDEERLKAAEVTERTVQRLETIETSTQAASGRQSAVDAIKLHMTGIENDLRTADSVDQEKTRASLTDIAQKISELISSIQQQNEALRSGAAREDQYATAFNTFSEALKDLLVSVRSLETKIAAMTENDLKPPAALVETDGKGVS